MTKMLTNIILQLNQSRFPKKLEFSYSYYELRGHTVGGVSATQSTKNNFVMRH